ncbi:MAG: hypothetical protein JXB05_22590 [Myxococcaceae bacterium]|nr:hypothetical protein [Myxococcaceae bacterium]
MSNIPEVPEKNPGRSVDPSTEYRLTISGAHPLVELEPEQLRAVVGGSKAKPKIKVVVSPDGTITVTVE